MLSPWTHTVQVWSGARCFARRQSLKFSSPGGTAQRPLLGMWLVPMEPNWFQQSHLAATHRRRTAASGTNEFQIRPDSQLQHKCAWHALRGAPRRALLASARRRIFETQPAAAKSACRQYRAARWFLLPEGELAAAGSGQQTMRRSAISSTSRLFSSARDAYGRRRQETI